MTPEVKHRVVAKTASYSIESRKDRSGTIFTNRGASGAVTFTLPPASRCQGWEYTFVGVANQNIIVAARTVDTLIGLNDVDLDSLALQTAGQLIGGVIKVFCDGTSWIAFGSSVGHTFTGTD
jgi:hypothetical protein